MRIHIIPKRKIMPYVDIGGNKLEVMPYTDTGAYFLNVVENRIARTLPSVGAIINNPTLQGTLTATSLVLKADITPAVDGVKIGTATTQKLAFYNSPPVVQPAVITDPSGGSTTDTQARDAIVTLIDRLQSVGLIGV